MDRVVEWADRDPVGTWGSAENPILDMLAGVEVEGGEFDSMTMEA